MTPIYPFVTLGARCRFAAALLICLGVSSAPAAAEYLLHPGDTLEISVTGAGLKQKAVIGLDGEISLPLYGQLNVGGLPVSAAKEKIVRAVSNRVYPQMGAGGRDVPSLILPEDVVVTVAEYRPIYISGDVAKPGEYAFRAGMTAQQAVALAGGVGKGSAATNPYLEEVDLRAEREALSADLANKQALSWRLHSQLAQPNGGPAPSRGALGPGNDHHFLQTESQQYQASYAEHREDQKFLRDAIAKINQQLRALADSQKRLEGGYKADLVDYERVRQLYAKGLATIVRLSEARRVALASSDQILQINVQITNAEQQRDDYTRKLGRLSSQSRIYDLKELQATDLRIAEINARVRGIDEKLAYIKRMKVQSADGTSFHPTIIVTRTNDKKTVQLNASGSSVQLEPGDVVNVSMPQARTSTVLSSSENVLIPTVKPVAR
jgi:polysaccharide biosynthesis/export protein